MSRATCPVCGKSFEKDEPWKKTCLPCWQKKKRAEESPFSGTDELLDARLEIKVLRQQLSTMLLLRPKTVGIEPDMLARLIRLCHPDLHSGSEASTKATQWLLEQRA